MSIKIELHGNEMWKWMCTNACVFTFMSERMREIYFYRKYLRLVGREKINSFASLITQQSPYHVDFYYQFSY